MGTGIYFPLCAIPFSLIIIILFYTKGHINSKETWIFNTLIVSNIFGLMIELLCTYASVVHETEPLLSNIIYKSYLLYLVLWISTMTYYVFSMTRSDNSIKKERIPIFFLYYVIVAIILIILPIDVVIKDNFTIRYTTGLSVQFTYIVSAIAMIIMAIILITHFKKIRNKRYLPVVIFLTLGAVVATIQMIYPQLLLMTYLETFICVIMYFTIENPDLKVIDELNHNRLLIEKNNEDRSNMLFRLTQEVRYPITEIKKLSKNILNKDPKGEIKTAAQTINDKSAQIIFFINDVLDITQMDITKIKVMENNYNVNNLFNEIIFIMKNEIPDGVEFRHSISGTVPKALYGDKVKIKQILCSLLFNATKYTKKGFVELSIDAITKYDLCRLIFTVQDSGKGMSLEQVNTILNVDADLTDEDVNTIEQLDVGVTLLHKMVKLLGGSLFVKSEEDKGTTFIITLDQKIYDPNNTAQLDKSYANIMYSKKRVLLVSDNQEILTEFKKPLVKNNYEVTTTMYGRDVINRLRNDEKYDLIIMESEMKLQSGVVTYEEMKKIPQFDTPTIIMVNDYEEEVKHHFVDDYGFSDCFVLGDFAKEMERILKKY